jgi:hypothetical protein
MTSLKRSLVVCIVILLSVTVVTTSAAHAVSHHQHHRSASACKPPYTTLYVYTFPGSKECVLLEHNGKVVQAQAQNNTDYNTTAYDIPSENHGTQNVDWNTATITTIPYKQVSVFCMPVRLPSLVWYNWCIW